MVRPRRKKLIDNHTAALLTSFQRPRADVAEESLKQAFEERRYADMLEEIKQTMQVGCRVRLAVHSGRPNGDLTWIKRPTPFPRCGTTTFRNLCMPIFVHEQDLRIVPFAAFASAVAHEFAHIVLESTRHPLLDSEEAVDITAMILGFRSLGIRGNVYSYHEPNRDLVTVTAGYLNPSETRYVSRKLVGLRSWATRTQG